MANKKQLGCMGLHVRVVEEQQVCR